MTNDDLAERVASIAALADPIRRDLYFYVTAQPAPVSRDRASDALGIARHTAKFHLDKLTEEGLLDIEFKRLTERRGPGAGRPTKLYQRSSRQLSVTLPERRYDLAAQLLASAVEATADGTLINDSLKVAAADSGRSVGDQARAAAGPQASRERLLDCTCEALSECGYAPRRTGSTIVLSNCPFDTLAREHTQLICGMNLAMLAAVIEQVQETALSARLEPATVRCSVISRCWLAPKWARARALVVLSRPGGGGRGLSRPDLEITVCGMPEWGPCPRSQRSLPSASTGC